MEETIKLGGNIELSGFSSLDGGQMIVLKKIVGNYARKMEEQCKSFEALKLTMKPVGEEQKFELKGQVIDGGNIYPSAVTEHNLFVGVDSVLKKLISTLN
ncbi:hypothetical protein ACFLZB_02180 [Nanoarchaeota archaeon]